jgi:DNA modification methylase
MNTPEPQAGELKAFLEKHAREYDPDEDYYERPPFAADIKEGKNDPIYNAHSYHTKVPPRSIIPYILHYTQPGDVVLDPFCGSGMTGVAAQMCADPPQDILAQFPEIKDRVGPRACILNDLSPAACHIAYNYNTPVDVVALRGEFERIREAVKDEFAWLYGTEHYEPAAGVYDVISPEVASRLKNPPDGKSRHNLLEEEERIWELLTKAEVEMRLGYPVSKLPRDKQWGDLDVANVQHWICIPATIQYTIWSDVYRCEGLVTIEEQTGKVSTRGKNAGQPMLARKRVARGCAMEIIIWDAAVGADGEVSETFNCPHCAAEWKKMQIPRLCSIPVLVNITAVGIKQTKAGISTKQIRCERRIADCERHALTAIEAKTISYWVPDTEMDTKGPQYRRNALQVRKIRKVTDFWSPRNLWAYSSLWQKASAATETRVGEVLRFALTGITSYITKKQAWGTGGGGLSGQLYLSSFPLEKNVWTVFERKVEQLIDGYSTTRGLELSQILVTTGSATKLAVCDECVDYVFTDPPFGSNIYYSEPNLLWEAWLGKVTDQTDEAVVHRKNDGGTKRLPDYARLMRAAFNEIFRVLKPGRWATVEFNNSDGSVFEAIKLAVREAGFEIVNMLLLDKKQKTFKQVKGAEGVEDVVDKDVLFNLYKPAVVRREMRNEDGDLEQQVAEAVRQHLASLPERMVAEPAKYSDDHRTTATINSMLMNALIPRGVSVERLNLPFIERVCSRFFRKIGQRWYLRGEAVGGKDGELVTAETAVSDELSAIAWLRQKVQAEPKLIGELKPVWMKATGLLPAALSETLVLEHLLLENFWRDSATNRWREPTAEEREKINDDRSLRVLHDAERLADGRLDRTPTSGELCDWIRVLFETCKELEEDPNAQASHLGFDKSVAYRLIVSLSHHLTSDGVEPAVLNAAKKQSALAGRRLAEAQDGPQATAPTKRIKDDKQGRLDLFS